MSIILMLLTFGMLNRSARTMIPARPPILFIICGDERKVLWPGKRVSAPGCAARSSLDIAGSMVSLYENKLLRIINFQIGLFKILIVYFFKVVVLCLSVEFYNLKREE